MTDPDQIQSVLPGPEVETVVKGSRFLAQVFPAASYEASRVQLQRVAEQYDDANHHCWALRLSPPESCEERSSDDGEPSGTAGQPILGALQREELYDALIVVTRYFGGTKLGKGGLVRAYGDAARAALAETARDTIWRKGALELLVDYADMGAVETVLARNATRIFSIDRSFDPSPKVSIVAKASALETLRASFIEATAGRVRFPTNPSS